MSFIIEWSLDHRAINVNHCDIHIARIPSLPIHSHMRHSRELIDDQTVFFRIEVQCTPVLIRERIFRCEEKNNPWYRLYVK